MMVSTGKRIWASLWLICAILGLKAQEQESAELFLDEYTDEFQNLFFEALKQKGIQNYDRAIENLLDCKNLDPESTVVDYELARAYFLDNKSSLALGYAVSALEREPENFWYLELLITILEKQGNTLEAYSDRVALSNAVTKQNLAQVYFQKKKYKDALAILGEIGDTAFSKALMQKIKGLQKKNRGTKSTARVEAPERNSSEIENPVANYQKQIEDLILSGNYQKVVEVAKEAMDSYPLQAYFQYSYGLGLCKTGQEREGIEILEMSLDYIFDNIDMRNKVYRALSETFSEMGNEKKANEYSDKIEKGS